MKNSPASEPMDVIAAVYAAGAKAEHWPKALQQFAALFGASHAELVLAGPNGQLEQIGPLRPDPLPNSYGHHGRIDPVVQMVLTAPQGTILTDTVVLAGSVPERTGFHHDSACRPEYCSVLAVNFICERGNAGVAVLYRSQREGDFAKDDFDLVGLLLPHLQRSIRMHLRLTALDDLRQAANEALDNLDHGVLVTDGSCRIMFANRVAGEILAEVDGIRSRRLAVRTPKTNELRRLVAQACGADGRPAVGGALLVDRPMMKRPLHLLVSPLSVEASWGGLTSPAAIVLMSIIDPERAPRGVEQHLRTIFKLTPAEARVARAIAAGESLISVAETLGVLPSTARTHLHRVFEKTETKCQAELVKLAGRIAVR